jgi:two-component system copper resistance phosphate regulon response regulator CusR
MGTVLVVDDDPINRKLLARSIVRDGHAVIAAEDGRQALDRVRDETPDVVLLDILMPGMDGFAVLKQIKADSALRDIPVIMISALEDFESVIRCIELGADDYLPKPFAFDELLARIRARLRPERDRPSSLLVAGGIELDLLTREASAGGQSVELTAREFSLLETLLRHPGQVLSREQLLSRVWGLDFDPQSNRVDVYIGYLRRKLGADRIETVRGTGYRLVVNMIG